MHSEPLGSSTGVQVAAREELFHLLGVVAGADGKVSSAADHRDVVRLETEHRPKSLFGICGQVVVCVGGGRVFGGHGVKCVAGDRGEGSGTSPSWDLIADLVPTWSGPGKIGRPAKHAKRDTPRRSDPPGIVNAILYVARDRVSVAGVAVLLPELEHGAPLPPGLVP